MIANVSQDVDAFTSNAFLVTGSRSVLVDPGNDYDAAGAVRERTDGLDAVVLTHTHPDHVGNVPAVSDAFDAEGRAPEIDGPGKPAPDVYELAVASLGVSPTDCLVVEDSATGIEAASRAGAYVIAYRAPGFDGDQDASLADEVVEGPSALSDRVRVLVLGDPTSDP
jgi:beta-phosphoglucomutase-like phosphatase (HAD superfamily)